MTTDELLRGATSVYVIDWPSRDIPDTLARAGILTTVSGGPSPDEIDVFAVGDDGSITITKRGAPPDRADFVFSHRPVIVEGAGLTYIDGPDLADEVRRVRGLT